MYSPLGTQEAGARLAAAIVTRGLWHPRSENRPFTGGFTGTAFDMMRSSRGRNSFRPRIRGTIESTAGGTRIRGTMQLDQSVLVFVGVFVAYPAWLFVSLMLASNGEASWDARVFALPAGIVAVVAMTLFGFAHESRRALEELAVLLDGKASFTPG
jgi:hypothetical protein